MSDDTPEPIFGISASRGFEQWLAAQKASIAFSTYQVGKVFLIGLKPDGRLWVFNRDVGRCLGLAVHGPELWIAAESRIYRFIDGLTERPSDASDALYVPQAAYFTGDVDAHDIAIGSAGPVFANTRFNCLAAPSQTHNFRPLWKPSFISRLVAEDRCHLNGVALVDGRAKYVTCISSTDTYDSWREHRVGGGVVIDVDSSEIVGRDLGMPHSPRWRAGKLWLLNSATGELGHLDLKSGGFVPLCFCPGYLRGLAFVGEHFALVGLSRTRGEKLLTGLPLDEALAKREVASRCGIYVIDIRSGAIVHSLAIEGVVSELYDVVAIPGIRQPSMIGLDSEEQKRTISIEA